MPFKIVDLSHAAPGGACLRDGFSSRSDALYVSETEYKHLHTDVIHYGEEESREESGIEESNV